MEAPTLTDREREIRDRYRCRPRPNLRQNVMAIVPMSRGCPYWFRAINVAKQILSDNQHHPLVSPAAGPPRLLKLSIQLSFGLNFFMSFRVKGVDGSFTTYTAIVLVRPADMGIKLISLQKKIPSAKLKNTKKLVVIYPPSEERMSSDNDEDELVLGENPSRLHSLGYNILLEQTRSNRPDWKFATAKRYASSKWKKLLEHEKMVFLSKAAKRLKEKKPPGDNVSNMR